MGNDVLQAAVRSASSNEIVLHEASRPGGFGAEIVARLQELLRNEIALKIARVATPDMRIPASPILQRPLSSHGCEATVSGALIMRIDCSDPLCFLPLFRYLRITVQPLASHPNDPMTLDRASQLSFSHG